MFELLYIDGLVVIFRGMMRYQHCGQGVISTIGVVVYVILRSEDRVAVEFGDAVFFRRITSVLFVLGSVLHQLGWVLERVV